MFITLAHKLWPAFARVRYGELCIVPCDNVRDAFRELKGQATIICPNHCAHEDADIMFGISSIVGEKFSFLTAREIFGNKNTLNAKFLQKMGCYSIKRGLPDIHSFKSTKELLTYSAGKIVMFPEGEITHQNNHLNRLENGPEYFAFAALKELRLFDLSRSIFILPLALKYSYRKDIRQELYDVMGKIESSLGLPVSFDQSLRKRLKHAFQLMLCVQEELHKGSSDKAVSLNKRLSALCEQIIVELQAYLNVKVAGNLNQLTRIHILKNAFTERHLSKEEHSELERLHYKQLVRLINLISIGDHSFDHELTQEEAAELLFILEYEVLNTLTIERPSFVFVSAGLPINIEDYRHLYDSNHSQAIEAVKKELEHRLAARLKMLQKDSVNLFVT